MKRLIKSENEYIYKMESGAIYKVECSEESYPLEKNVPIRNDFEFIDDLKSAIKNYGEDIEFLDSFNNNLKSYLKSIKINFDVSKAKLITTVISTKSLNDNDLQVIKDYMEGQFSDGWGESFEQTPIKEYIDDYEYEEEDEYGDIDVYMDACPAEFSVYVSFYGKGITYDWI